MQINTHRKAILILFLLTFALLNITYFSNLHFHSVGGAYIVHSHPFGKSNNSTTPIQSHHHNNLQLLAIQLIYSIEIILILMGMISLFYLFYHFFHKISSAIKRITSFFNLPLLRAPPLFVVLY